MRNSCELAAVRIQQHRDVLRSCLRNSVVDSSVVSLEHLRP